MSVANCPNCGAEHSPDLSECPKCQIIFAKWRAMHEAAARTSPNIKIRPRRDKTRHVLTMLGISTVCFAGTLSSNR